MCRELQKGSVRCRISIKLDEYPVTRLAVFGDPRERLCMVAAAKTIHTIKLNEDGTLQGKPIPDTDRDDWRSIFSKDQPPL